MDKQNGRPLLKGYLIPTRTLPKESFKRSWRHHYDVIDSLGHFL